MPLFLKFYEPKSLIAKFYKDTWTPGIDDEFRSDIDSHASTGTNVDTKTCAFTGTTTAATANNQANILIDITDLSWTNVTSTNLGYIVFYENSGAAATDRLVFYIDVRSGGSGRSVTNDDIDVQFDANGVYRVTI